MTWMDWNLQSRHWAEAYSDVSRLELTVGRNLRYDMGGLELTVTSVGRNLLYDVDGAYSDFDELADEKSFGLLLHKP